MELNWKASFSASCFHTCHALFQDYSLRDERLSKALSPHVQTLRNKLLSAGILPQRFWKHAVALSANIESNRELVELILRKAVGNVARPTVDSLITVVSGIESSTASIYPKLADDVTLRIRPIREQWESRGPGLLWTVATLTDDRVLVPNADVIVVHPVLGGSGAAHLEYNSVRIEGVLANEHRDLPETLRLAWLLSQLNSDLPTFADRVPGEMLSLIAQLAFVPAVLQAAENVEWSVCDCKSIQLALNVWGIPVPGAQATGELLLDWWQTYRESRPSWEIGLGALHQMYTQSVS